MIGEPQIMETLHGVPDPEMPISIVDLGLVEGLRLEPSDAGDADTAIVHVTMLPTFVGCPALDMIRDDVVAKLGVLPGVAAVHVDWVFDPPWTVDRITEAGRASLRDHGVTVPEQACSGDAGATVPVPLTTSAIPCPFCGGRQTRMESAFGPTRCRSIHYCEGCRNTFEHMKRVDATPRAN